MGEKCKWIKKITDNGINYFIEAEKKYKIREDFIKIYEESLKYVINDPITRKRTSPPNYQWYSKAVWSSKYAISFDPHKKVIESVNNGLEKVGVINGLLSFFQVILFAIGSFIWIVNQILFNSIGTLLFIIGMPFILCSIILIFYKRLLLLDTQAFQSLNNKLVIIPEERCFKNAKKEQIISIYIWNRSLCNYDTIPTIALLIVFKKLIRRGSDLFIDNMINVVAPYTPTYLDTKSRSNFIKYLMDYYRHNSRSLLKKKKKEDSNLPNIQENSN